MSDELSFVLCELFVSGELSFELSELLFSLDEPLFVLNVLFMSCKFFSLLTASIL